jgi:hypothetical protein
MKKTSKKVKGAENGAGSGEGEKTAVVRMI